MKKQRVFLKKFSNIFILPFSRVAFFGLLFIDRCVSRGFFGQRYAMDGWVVSVEFFSSYSGEKRVHTNRSVIPTWNDESDHSG